MVVIATALWRVSLDLLSFVLIRRPDYLFAYFDETYLAHGDDCHSFGCSTIGVSLIFLSTFPTGSGIPNFQTVFSWY